MQPFDFQPVTRVVFGENALDRLGSFAEELGGRRVLVVTDPGVVRAGIVERALHSLKRASLSASVFEEVEENPTTRHVEAGTRFARAQEPVDLIVGLGGGSAMDCAKGINFLVTNGGAMEDYWGVDRAARPLLPSIGVPTTAGTGSEAQSFALIAQEETHRKMACGDKKARFRAVILDPILTKSAPKRVAAAAGIDAISHAVESYVTTRRNPISQMFAREAWGLLERSFEMVLSDPESPEARGRMLLGAHLAGAAIENSMLGAAHACANPLTARYGIAHGIAVALMLPHVVRFNGRAVGRLYRDLALAGQGSTADDIDGAEALIERIVELKTAAAVPERLRALQVKQTALPRLAKEAADQWTGTFNPRPVNEVDLLKLYEFAY